MPESLPRPRAVDGGGVDQLRRDILQRGEEIDHVEACVEPERGEDEGGHRVRLEPRKIGIPSREQRVEGDIREAGALFKNQAEQQRDEHEADERGREKHQPKKRASAQLRAVEQQRESECDGELHEDAAEGEEQGIRERLPKERVMQEERIVPEADEHARAGAVGLLEREGHRAHERPRDERREQQQPGREEKPWRPVREGRGGFLRGGRGGCGAHGWAVRKTLRPTSAEKSRCASASRRRASGSSTAGSKVFFFSAYSTRVERQLERRRVARVL